MIERLVAVFFVSITVFAIYIMLKRSQMKTVNRAAKLNKDMGSDGYSNNPEIIYFWSDQCQQCQTIQSPVLDSLLNSIGEQNISIKKYNVISSPMEVKKWGVKTVPTVILLDKNGDVKNVYNGVVSENKLRESLNPIF